MEYKELIKARYSCRKFSNEQITKEQLDAILEAGQVSLTAKNLQPQKIYVAQKEEDLAKIDAITPCRYGAPTALIVAYDKTSVYTYPGDKYQSGPEDMGIVATHMILGAKDVGVDSCWLNNFDPDKVAEVFGLPENEEVVMIMDLGYAAEDCAPAERHFQTKELSEMVTYL
ncbi:MAG: nitroreductase family protein [Mogibacterium sp.]|nr:nitroreductase family protein [Mogibacterium sp.]